MERTYVAEVTRVYDDEMARVFVHSALPGWPHGRAFPLPASCVKGEFGEPQQVREGDLVDIVIRSEDAERIVRATVRHAKSSGMKRGRGGGRGGRSFGRPQAAVELPPTTTIRA